MKVLLDNGLPRSATNLLIAEGIDAVHVGMVGMAAAEDTVILNYARSNALVIVTLDADFHTLLALTGASGPSVIRVRVEGLKGPALTLIVSRTIRTFGAELKTGAVISVGPLTARCHLLPL